MLCGKQGDRVVSDWRKATTLATLAGDWQHWLETGNTGWRLAIHNKSNDNNNNNNNNNK